MRLASTQPNFRVLHDLGLSEPDAPNEPRAFARDSAKTAGLLALFWIAGLVSSCVALLAIGPLAAFVALIITMGGGMLWTLARQRRFGSTIVLRIQKHHQTRIFAAMPVLYVVIAIFAFSMHLTGVAIGLLVLALISAILATRVRLVPPAIDQVRSALRSHETPQADALAVDSARKWRMSGGRILAVTNERVLLASNGIAGEQFVCDIEFEDIERFEVKWLLLGNMGSITLHFRRPLVEFDSRDSIKLSQAAPRNIARVASALRDHGVAGPVIDLPTGSRSTHNSVAGVDAKRKWSVRRVLTIIGITWLAVSFSFFVLANLLQLLGVDFRQLDNRLQQRFGTTYVADGRSNLTGGGASIEYPASSDLVELRLDEDWDDGPNDGARWELRSKASDGYNVVSLSNYVFLPLLDNPAAVERWVDGKQAEREDLADGRKVTYTTTKVDGRTGYVWSHLGKHGYWYYAAWFPDPEGTIRLECIAKEQRVRFEKLCSDALKSLTFNDAN